MNERQVDILDMSGLLDFEPRRVRAFVRALDANLPARLRAPSGDLSVAFFDDAGIAGIHADFMNNPDPTDVITFEGDPEDGFAGEICACAETALKRAGDFGNTPSRELCLYVAHGYLHLAGVDDISPEDAANYVVAACWEFIIPGCAFDVVNIGGRGDGGFGREIPQARIQFQAAVK